MGDEEKEKSSGGQDLQVQARLNVGGHKQVKHVNYWQTYSPVIGWPIVRLFLTLSIIYGWVAKQYDFELAYPQADIETTMYMDVPRGLQHRGKRKLLYQIDKKTFFVRSKQEECQSKYEECRYFRIKTILRKRVG